MRRRGPTRAQPLSLSDIERYISELAELCDWRHHRAAPSALTAAGYADGFPSDVLVREGRLIFITIAAPGGLLIPPASAWARELEAVWAVEMLVLGRSDLRPLGRALQPPRKARGPR